MVVFGDEVTKILCNSLFIFHFVLPILPCKQKTLYRKSCNLSDEKPKTKLPKYVMSRAKIMNLRRFWGHFFLHLFIYFPGYVHRYPSLTNSKDPRENNEEFEDARRTWKECDACDMHIPQRTYHCSLCNCCISIPDHHCYFLGKN